MCLSLDCSPGLLFLILVFLAFERRKVAYLLFVLIAYQMFEAEGILYASVYWVVMHPLELATNFLKVRYSRSV